MARKAPRKSKKVVAKKSARKAVLGTDPFFRPTIVAPPPSPVAPVSSESRTEVGLSSVDATIDAPELFSEAPLKADAPTLEVRPLPKREPPAPPAARISIPLPEPEPPRPPPPSEQPTIREAPRKPRPGAKLPDGAAPQAMVKAVLIPEIDSDPPHSSSRDSSSPGRGHGPLARLRKAAERGGRQWLTRLASSPNAMQTLGAALAGGQAIRALLAPGNGELRIDDFGQDSTALERFGPTLDFFYDHYWRVDVRGIENLPTSGPLLAICNHAGALPLDGPIVRSAIERNTSGRRVRWLVEDAVFHAPFLGNLLNRLGAVRACPENADRLLEDGQALAVFPEGIWGIQKSWRKRYQLQRFGRGGFVKLALRHRAPLIPTAVIGAEEAMPILATVPASPLGVPFIPITPTFPFLGLLGLLPLPTKWTVVFAPPVDLTKYGPEDASNMALVQRLTEEVRERLHEQISRVRAEGRPVFRS